MKTIPVFLLVAGMLFPATCLAESADTSDKPTAEKKGGPRGPRKPFAETWKAADLDGDNRISIQEFPSLPRMQNLSEEKREAIFKRLDKNTDTQLSLEELSELGKRQPGFSMKRLWELDADKSDSISFEEFKTGPISHKLPMEKQQEVFKKLDTDGDGFITKKDRPDPPIRPHEKHHRKAPTESPLLNLKLDLDGDGVLSFAEFRKGPAVKNLDEDQQEERFEVLDKNNDLKLSAADFPAPLAK
jgi:Ca2+-binding EF-hand superfamily protein